MSCFIVPKRAVKSIEGWATSNRILIMADKKEIDEKPNQEKNAGTYRTESFELIRRSKLESKDETIHALPGEGELDNAGHGVEPT
ncbi:hypothetical protein O1611_g8117 [Lasiodiplodia mahajangana]|uniref:Uncharacterized protein n=1 Tax=Lasiodiplodia mahajangana TaxID=1108764 RepID=A0ACC2JDC0_9PEZI|nr:hypothetical protein O1611_g8117 [Lasiodiplodia mahajangana]